MTETNQADRPGGPRPIDHRVAPTRTAVVVDVRGLHYRHSLEMRHAEFDDGLARAIGVDLVLSQTIRVREIKPAARIPAPAMSKSSRPRPREREVELLVDAALAPVQQSRDRTGRQVLDRTG